MADVFFTFTKHSGEDDRAALLRRLRRMEGVVRCDALSPGSTHPDVSRIGCVEVVNDDGAARLLEHLRQDPLIESADPPPHRMLV